MRPRTQFFSFRPPVSLGDLRWRMPESGYLLVTEPDSDEIAAAVACTSCGRIPEADLDRQAEPVIYVPWCTTVADALEGHAWAAGGTWPRWSTSLGETIGILTFDDILDTIFSGAPSRSERLLRRAPSGGLPRACGTSPA